MSCCTEKPLRMTMNKDGSKQNQSLMVVPRLKCQADCDNCKKEKEKKASRKKVITLVLLLLVNGIGAMAADSLPSTKSFWDDPFNHPMLPLYTVSTFVFITVLLAIIVSLYAVRILNIFIRKTEEERALKLGVPIIKQPTWWDKLWQSANNMVPLEEEKNIELDHNFDGIKELDNHLPPWWTMLFYGCIIWSVFYLFVYHVFNSLPLSEGEYKNELAAAEESAQKFRASQPMELIDENTLVYDKDETMIGKGQIIFNGNCVACHKADGGGNTIGPNLTDEYWIHGGNVKEVFKTIRNGVVEKGMPVWGKAMSPQDVKAVTFFVMSLRGTHPKEAKAPQGKLYKEDTNKVALPDSLSTQASLIKK
jgi:cytochrome c oxidase cbb3-type subunit 3